MISAASEHDLRAPFSWAILDIGFARDAKSCGLLLPGQEPRCVRFGEARARLGEFVTECTSPINLLIEAPLSVAFSQAGNPTGRSVELRDGKHRYWYAGLGASVMVAALYLIRDLYEREPVVPVRLVEGFVSFKAKGKSSNHLADVTGLERVIADPVGRYGHITAAASLRVHSTDILESAGKAFGMDFGIPPVVVATAA